MEERRCERCFEPNTRAVCPHCGWPTQGHNAPHQLPVGTEIAGRFRLGGVLGQGGFGITYLGWDLMENRPVAVKEYFPGSIVFRRSSMSPDVECTTREAEPHFQSGKERFLREAQALTKLRHLEGVVDILDLAEANNTAYIIMEYIRGRDLRGYVRERGGKLTVDETLTLLKPAMEALAKVHRQHIIHRDIAPDNIILGEDGRTKLLDFGSVRTVVDPSLSRDPTSSTEAILKHGFAPMEQYTNHGRLGPWTDEYAMCATVWYCLTGQVPPDAPDRLIGEKGTQWSTIPGLNRSQREALERGFSPDPKDRFGSMDALIDALYPKVPPKEKKEIRVISDGTMDNGTREIHYIDQNGNMMRVYSVRDIRKESFFSRLLKKTKKKKKKQEKIPEFISIIPKFPERRWPEFPDDPPTGRPWVTHDPRQVRLTHQAVVYGLKTDTARYAMDFAIFPETILRNPTWEKRLLAQSGARADEIFSIRFPGEEGGSRFGEDAFRCWERDGLTVVKLPDEDEDTAIWCRAYVLRGTNPRDFRFFTVEQTPDGVLIGLVDRDLRHYHLTEAADNLRETLYIIRDLEIV